MANRAKNLVGKQFSYLTVLARAGSNKAGNALWECECICGKKVTRTTYMLTTPKVRVKSCGCRKEEAYIHGRGHSYAPVEVLGVRIAIENIKQRSKVRGHLFGLSEVECKDLFLSPCYYCGAPPSNVATIRRRSGNEYFYYSGVDRIDSSKGYVAENVVPACKFCNHAKSDRTTSEFLEWIERAYLHIHSNKRGITSEEPLQVP
jgi:hypothetical protein